MDRDGGIRTLERLRAWRAPRTRDLGIHAMLDRCRRDAERTHRKLGSIIEAWEDVLPDDLAEHTAVASLRAGTLMVDVDGAATSWSLDRFLRGGGLAELRRRARTNIFRVRTRVGGAMAKPDGPKRV